MAIKWLDAKRLQGTNAERLALTDTTFPDAFAIADISANTNASQPYTVSSTPIYGQDSMYFDALNTPNGTWNSYLGGLQNSGKTQWADLGELDWTLAFWLKYDTDQGGRGHVNETSTGSIVGTINPFQSGGSTKEENGFYVALDDGGSEKFMVHMASDDGASGVAFDEQLTNAIALQEDKWHHYAFLFNNTDEELVIYRDGTGETTSATQTIAYDNQITSTPSTTYNSFDIGRTPSENGRLLKEGYLNDMMIFNRLLETSELNAMFNGYTPATSSTEDTNTGKNLLQSGVSTAGCLAWWKMNAITNGVSDGFVGNSVSTSTYPELVNGTIFNETDTYKYFMFDGTDTWNQMVSS